jgi:hypothetical protein
VAPGAAGPRGSPESGARRRSRPGEDGGRVFNRRGLDLGGWLALGSGRHAAHRWLVAAAATGSTAVGRCSPGLARRGKGRRGGGVRAQTRRPAPYKQASRTGQQQRTDRRSPGCTDRGTASQCSYASGTTPYGSGRVSPRGARPWGVWPRAGRSP